MAFHRRKGHRQAPLLWRARSRLHLHPLRCLFARIPVRVLVPVPLLLPELPRQAPSDQDTVAGHHAPGARTVTASSRTQTGEQDLTVGMLTWPHAGFHVHTRSWSAWTIARSRRASRASARGIPAPDCHRKATFQVANFTGVYSGQIRLLQPNRYGLPEARPYTCIGLAPAEWCRFTIPSTVRVVTAPSPLRRPHRAGGSLSPSYNCA